jgi:hypothetical protein
MAIVLLFAEGGEGEEIVSATLSFPRLSAYRGLLDWKKGRQSQLIIKEMKKASET